MASKHANEDETGNNSNGIPTTTPSNSIIKPAQLSLSGSNIIVNNTNDNNHLFDSDETMNDTTTTHTTTTTQSSATPVYNERDKNTENDDTRINNMPLHVRHNAETAAAVAAVNTKPSHSANTMDGITPSINDAIVITLRTRQDNDMGDQFDEEMTQPRRARVYPADHKGPYNVYIRASKDAPLRHVSLAKHLFDKYQNGKILKISQMNSHKLRVEFSSLASANDLATCSDPVLELYRVYIPAEQVEVEGVVRLSVGDPESDLLEFGRGQFGEASLPEVNVIGVYRFERVVTTADGSKTRVPTPLVRVTFPGSLLPARIVIDGLILPMEPYKKKAMFCENCLRTGHTQKFCVVKPKCSRCGEEHSTETCLRTSARLKCFVCDTDHDPDDRSRCPKIAQANTLQHRKLKQKINQSYAEAVKHLLRNPNQFEILSQDEEDFDPQLHDPLTGQPPARKRRKPSLVPKAVRVFQATGNQLGASQTQRSQATTSLAGDTRARKVASFSQGPQSSNGIAFRSNSTTSQEQSRSSKTDSRRVGFNVSSQSGNQSDQSVASIIRNLINSLLNVLPISGTLRQLIGTAVNVFCDTILPLLSPLIAPLLSSLFNPSSFNDQNGC